LELREQARFGVAAQTTQPIERVRELVAAIRQRFPRSEVRFIDTVCRPTKQRQAAAIELAQQVEVVVVIGGLGSMTGSVVGALLVGLSYNYVAYLVPKAALGITMLLLVIILSIRPTGLFPEGT
jgi:hypothetical protein